jgi:hypothetical protein
MTKLIRWKAACAAAVVVAGAVSAQGQVFTKLVTFNITNGVFPVGALIQGTDGNLYGTTIGGGALTTAPFFG